MSFPNAKLLAHLAGAAILGSVVAGCSAMPTAGFNEEFQHGYILDERAVMQVRPGNSAEDVLKTLGTPSTVSTVGNKSWYYISQQTKRPVMFMGQLIQDQRVTAVYFNQAMRVERVAVYGMQEGKVFDFISRTTPSGGSDQNFLSQALRGLGTFVPNT